MATGCTPEVEAGEPGMETQPTLARRKADFRSWDEGVRRAEFTEG